MDRGAHVLASRRPSSGVRSPTEARRSDGKHEYRRGESMSNWYTCQHCEAKHNGEFKRDNHEAVNHPEQHRQRIMRNLAANIADNEQRLERQRASLAYLQAGHTALELAKHDEEALIAALNAKYRQEAAVA